MNAEYYSSSINGDTSPFFWGGVRHNNISEDSSSSTSGDADNDDSGDSVGNVSLDSEEGTTTATGSRTRTGKKVPVVTFLPRVDVVEIPNRFSYDPDTASSMWNDRKQIRRMAVKNTYEYSYENFDWRSAVEEEDFVLCRTSGDNNDDDDGDGNKVGELLIHPAHLAAKSGIPKRFGGQGRGQQQQQQQQPPCKRSAPSSHDLKNHPDAAAAFAPLSAGGEESQK